MKKNTLIKTIGTISVLVLAAVIAITNNKHGNKDAKVEEFEYKIEFPESAGHINSDLVTNYKINKNKIKNKEILQKYYIVKDEMSDSRKQHIKKSFEMEKADVDIKDKDDMIIEKYEKGNEQLTIYSNGTFHYKKDKNKDYSKMKNVDLEEGALVQKANKFLKDKELIPSDFVYSEIGETSIENLTTGEKTVVTKDLYYTREINGVEVEGTSKIIVSMNSDGDVEEIYSSYREIEEVVAVKENYTIDEMSAELENLNGKIYINADADEVTFEDVEVVYYEDSAPYSDNPTIQPIYKVKGSNKKNGKEIDDYYGLTSAVKR